MNLHKTLWTFMWVFLILDLVLAVQWLSVWHTADDPNSVANMRQEIQLDGIKTKKLAETNQEGKYLSAQDGTDYLRSHLNQVKTNWQVDFDNHVLNASPKETIILGTSSATAVEAGKKLLQQEKNVIAGQQYQYDRGASQQASEGKNGHILVFNQKAVGALPFVSSRAQLQLICDQDYRLIRYTQTYVKDIEVLRDVPVLISQERAFINAYQYNEVPNNAQLTWSKLGYSSLMTVDGNEIFIPTWSFTVKNVADESATIRINALNGALLQ